MKKSYKTSKADRDRSSKRYYKNRLAILQKNKENYSTNKEIILKRCKKYREQNKDLIRKRKRTLKQRFSNARYLGRLYHLWDIDYDQYVELIEQNCYYCGVSLKEESGIGLDRIRNKFDYTTDNVVPCCKVCNRIRSDIFTTQEMLHIGSIINDIRCQRESQHFPLGELRV